ncbi:MAG: DUF6883 domain-containing protein [Verrucomicrobiales bacterium]
MKLPHAEEAIVDISKVRNYCLNPQHPRGKHKARVFKSALGLTQADAEDLKAKIEGIVLIANCQAGEEDSHGQRFVVDFEIERGGRSAPVRTSWIVKRGEEAPRLTSCYIRE